MHVLFHSNEINVPGAVITLQRNVITASAYHYNSSCERTEVNSTHLSTCQKEAVEIYNPLVKKIASPFPKYVNSLFVSQRTFSVWARLQTGLGHPLVNTVE